MVVALLALPSVALAKTASKVSTKMTRASQEIVGNTGIQQAASHFLTALSKAKNSRGAKPGIPSFPQNPALLMTSTFSVLSPNGGDIWEKGQTYDITWDIGTAGSFVSLSLVSISNSVTVASMIDNDGDYSWTVPTDIPTGSYRLVLIGIGTDGLLIDMSDDFFSIAARPDANFDDNQIVDGSDLGMLLGSWGSCAAGCPADINRDFVVNQKDTDILIKFWGAF